MPDIGSVTLWLDRLKAGDRDEAVARLWRAYFARLIGLARRHLRNRRKAIADEEDVALSAFDSFVRAANAGRLPRLDDRDDLWQVLFMVTARKAADLLESENRQKRGGGQVIASLAGDGAAAHQLPAADRTPAEAAIMAEEFNFLLRSLADPSLRQIALWKLDGYSNAEIGAKLGRSVPTVERKLRRIRQIWQERDQ